MFLTSIFFFSLEKMLSPVVYPAEYRADTGYPAVIEPKYQDPAQPLLNRQILKTK